MGWKVELRASESKLFEVVKAVRKRFSPSSIWSIKREDDNYFIITFMASSLEETLRILGEEDLLYYLVSIEAM